MANTGFKITQIYSPVKGIGQVNVAFLLKPPHFHQYPHCINVIEITMIIMMVLQLLNIVTCGRCN